MLKILQEKIIFNDRFVINQGKIIDDCGNEFSRLCLKREDAAAVLIINAETNTIVLTRQFRYPISGKTKEYILEIVAGKVDTNEEPLETAIREAEEETGYRINSQNIKPILSCFSSPGYSSERFFIYLANVTNADKINKGGGLESENEYIEIVEMPIEQFKECIKNRTIEDAKTYIAGLYLLSLHLHS